MIRVNLLPGKRKRAGAASFGAPGSGVYWIAAAAASWLVLAGIGYWMVLAEEGRTAELKAKHAEVQKEVKRLKDEIDDEGLKKREQQNQELEKTIQELNTKRRTPVYVMYELAMILTDSAEGGGPDIDQERYRKAVQDNARTAEINEGWDPTGFWIRSFTQKGNLVDLEGGARDAVDINEFSRRIRASARFDDPALSRVQRITNKSGASSERSWLMSVRVVRWN